MNRPNSHSLIHSFHCHVVTTCATLGRRCPPWTAWHSESTAAAATQAPQRTAQTPPRPARRCRWAAPAPTHTQTTTNQRSAFFSTTNKIETHLGWVRAPVFPVILFAVTLVAGPRQTLPVWQTAGFRCRHALPLCFARAMAVFHGAHVHSGTASHVRRGASSFRFRVQPAAVVGPQQRVRFRRRGHGGRRLRPNSVCRRHAG